jgi:putative two-component system response regulator
MVENPRILVVDDELGPRESLRMILKDQYRIETASTGKQAIDLVQKKEFDLVILDIRMPEMSGIELLRAIRKIAPATEVIMITAYASVETATEALRLGAVDYLIKPFEISAVRSVVEKGLQKRNASRSVDNKITELLLAKITLEEEIKITYSNIKSHYRETIDSLVAAVDAKDSYTKGHQERVASLVSQICYQLGLQEADQELIRQAATRHDIGKIGVDERILRKSCGLTSDEYEIVKKHSAIGAAILSPATFLKDIVPLVLYHHERYDGKGYPEGLKSDNIPLGARIIAVADSIDAMLWDRPYAASKNLPEVEKELLRVAGKQLDPGLVDLVIEKKLVGC